MARMMADCRRWPSETNCSLVIIGDEDEVVQAAAEHAASVHGHENDEELRAQLRNSSSRRIITRLSVSQRERSRADE